MEEGKGIDDPRYETSVLSSGQLDLVGASKMARGRWRRRRKRVASYEGPNAFRPAKSESDNGAARLMTRNAFSSQPV